MPGLRMSNRTIAGRRKDMTLTRLERERITDSRLKIQAVANSLKDVDPKKVPDFQEIQDCLKDADKSLGGALRSSK
ncbi:hypothetical protein SBA4_3960005 [Candidatus Sulfopaludibacter sp. SbA4]|nr:hypothetical protein SBA4_3960005 [Candidatus Sulfopaludibacter sp. SbA4]